MPKIEPTPGPTGWPADEGTLGVVGVAPWATLDFLTEFYAGIEASKDWHYPRVIVDLNTKLPSRGRHLELGEIDPSPMIHQTIKELEAAGATTVVVACNTAHLLFSKWGFGHECTLLNIVDATVRALVASEQLGPVMVWASRSLSRHGLYEEALTSAGLKVITPTQEQVEVVARAIQAVKNAGALDATAQKELSTLALDAARRGVTAIVLGCTELSSCEPIVINAGLLAFDSNRELARAARATLGGPPKGGDCLGSCV